jgi:hypothetical protein
VDEHQSNRPGPDDGNGVANFNAGLVQPAQNAGQRLNHGRFLETYVRGNGEHVDIHDPSRDSDVFCISTVIKQQIFAEIFLVTRAVKAGLARRGI